MAIYAIGDIQGCFNELQKLLKKLNFDADTDQLWFAGDIVNRGPDSLKTLRFIKSLGDSAITVLGNHDLHLLAIAYTDRLVSKKDTLNDILNADDCDELLDWLRHRPLLHYDTEKNICMVHAGIYPAWSIKKSLKRASEVEAILRSRDYKKFLQKMYCNKPDVWSKELQHWDRYRFITNVFTRMRYCDNEQHLTLKYKGKPGSQPDNIFPWFELEHKRKNTKIIFGHWSTLGNTAEQNIYPLDTGCLWGGYLTALKINKKMQPYTQIRCPQAQDFD